MSIALPPLTASATSDSGGNIVFSFGAPPLGYVWAGSLQVPLASPAASFVVDINGIKIGSLNGTQVYGAFQVQQGSTLSVTGKNLAPSTLYTAVVQGSQIPTAQAPPGLAPSPVVSGPQPESIFSASNFSVSVGGYETLIPIDSSTQQYQIFAATVANFYNSTTAEPYVVAAIVLSDSTGSLGIASNTLVHAFSGANLPSSMSVTFPGGFVTAPGYGAFLVWVYSADQECLGSLAAVQIAD